MLSQKEITRMDQNKLYGIYKKWPDYFKDAVDVPYSLNHPASYYKCIIFAGMGGSGTSCDIMKTMIDNFGNLPTSCLRGESMPSYVDERALVIISSISGNTEEAVAMMNKALERNAETICISSGGKLKEITDRLVKSNARCRHVSIPNLFVPRASLPYLVIAGLNIISPFLHGLSLNHEVQLVSRNLSQLLDTNSIDIPKERNLAKKIAEFFSDGFAFCYSSPSLAPAAVRFKNSLNENAKIHCLSDSILEASHNDIVPFTFNHTHEQPKVLHLRWEFDDEMASERFEKVKVLLGKVVQPIMELTIPERNLLSAILSSIFILDLATIYIAFANSVDPSPTPAIEVLKGL